MASLAAAHRLICWYVQRKSQKSSERGARPKLTCCANGATHDSIIAPDQCAAPTDSELATGVVPLAA
jgi:hypothetical protein